MNPHIKQAIEEIQKNREILNELELFLIRHQDHFGGDVSTACAQTPEQVFVYAGKEPKEVAKHFNATFKIEGDSWRANFVNFDLVFMQATTQELVIL